MAKDAEQNADEASALLLKASGKRLFEKLMEQTPDRIYIKDRKSRFVAASQELAEMHGFKDRHELEGKTDFDLFSIEHAQQAFDDEQEIIRTGKPIVNKVEKETWHDKEATWVSSTKAPLYLGSGNLVGIIGISRDITAEKIAQEKLAESEKLLREQNAIMKADYESAKHVQSVMIPGRVPVVKHVELAYLWKPMTSVGGDMITFPRNPINCLLFFLGDVCGHGVTAAFYTVLLKYLTAHAAETYNADPHAFLDLVNHEVAGRIDRGFVTGLAGHFGHRNRDGSRKLFLAHAGHRQILLYRAKTKMIEMVTQPNGTVMGLPGSQPSRVSELSLQSGDRFYAFTDGILEAANSEGQEFGMKQLSEELRAASDQPLQESLQTLYENVRRYTGSPQQQDDITLLAFELE
ncbi:MAG: SpoIIE family protein phosphatase [Opitutales bacterium]